MRLLSIQTAIFLLPLLAKARTDLSGCVSSTVGPSLVWYVPGTGELCEFVDCGGGRAPPKSVPGCPLYTGTDTVTPSFLPGFNNAALTTSDTTLTTNDVASATSPTDIAPSTTEASVTATTSAPVVSVSSTVGPIETSSQTSSGAVITSSVSQSSLSDTASFAISTQSTDGISSSGQASSLYQISTGTANPTTSNSGIFGITTMSSSSTPSRSATHTQTSAGSSGTPSTGSFLSVVGNTLLLMLFGSVLAMATSL